MSWKRIGTRHGAPHCGGPPRKVIVASRSRTRDDGSWEWCYQEGTTDAMGVLTVKWDQGFICWFSEIIPPPVPGRKVQADEVDSPERLRVLEPALPALTYAPEGEPA